MNLNCYIRITPGLQDYILQDFLEFMGFSNYYYILRDYVLKELLHVYILWD